jgi:hypothetical protein
MINDKQKYLRELISKIKRLTSKEKHHILSIFKKYDVEFTKNSNGYFFNLDKVDESILDKVSKCVDLIEQKRELITSLDKKRDSYLEYYKNLIENKLKETINKRREQYINQLVLIPDNIPIKKKIKKSVRIISNVDPDILMREHNKSKKYNKNSVYFRINQRIVALSRKSNRHKVSDKKDDGDDTSFNYGGEGEDNVDGGAGISGDPEYESGDMEGLGDELEESIGEEYLEDGEVVDDDASDASGYGGNDTDDDVDDDEYYKDTNSDSEDDTNTEHKTEKTERTDNRTKTTKTKGKKKKKDVEASSNEIDYYKSLLKQSGFKFDDDKCVQIRVESYIE